ncbi:MAG: HAMP domain-containing sensor histidine kinase, partial [Actinomycetota bacterium]|nr:HAMP domain-containing sensor histidine kinase [Actinomycetota bacterium]
AALMSGWVASKALRPLRQMAETATRVSTSSLYERIDYDGPADELGVLADALDSMLDRLEGSFGEQKRFVADASHELRTPLTIISGHLEAAEHQTDAEEHADSLRIALDEVASMSRLVEDLLALARLDAGPPRPFQPLHVPTLAEEIAHRANSIGSRSVDVTCGGDMWIMGDPELLERAVMNLITNAFQHTPSSAAVALTCKSQGSRSLIQVMDNGSGIADEDLPRLFDRFYRASNSRRTGAEGAGLGLAIVKRLVDLHGGTVEVENGERGGVTFTISLSTIAPPE